MTMARMVTPPRSVPASTGFGVVKLAVGSEAAVWLIVRHAGAKAATITARRRMRSIQVALQIRKFALCIASFGLPISAAQILKTSLLADASGSSRGIQAPRIVGDDEIVTRCRDHCLKRSAPYGAGSQKGVAPVSISARSRPVAGPSVRPQWPWP